jgi:cell division topological specificity factor
MSILDLLFGTKPKTAVVAKERLQIILAHERSSRYSSPDFLPELQRELLAVISKYVQINPEDLKIQVESRDNLEVLEVKVDMPHGPSKD